MRWSNLTNMQSLCGIIIFLWRFCGILTSLLQVITDTLSGVWTNPLSVSDRHCPLSERVICRFPNRRTAHCHQRCERETIGLAWCRGVMLPRPRYRACLPPRHLSKLAGDGEERRGERLLDRPPDVGVSRDTKILRIPFTTCRSDCFEANICFNYNK